MKKVLLVFIPILLLITGCAGSAAPASGVANNVDLLDPAIREASDYLNGRIPSGNKVAFINISGGFPDLADYILNDLARHAVNDDIFSVVDRAQLEVVRAELNFNLSGEVSDDSAQEIGRMLGAQTIVTGGVRKIGNNYRLDVKAIEVQTATIQGSWSSGNIPNSGTIADLTRNTSGGTATAAASGGTSGGTAQAAESAQPAGPRNGTYTMYPRPMATEKGVPRDNKYISKIVVSNDYIVFYFDSNPIGEGGAPFINGTDDRSSIVQDLENPARSYTSVSARSGMGGGTVSTVSFQRFSATRFKLLMGGSYDYVFDGIVLGEPDED